VLYRAAVLLAIGWGVFTFGAVYPWGRLPLIAMAAALGATGMLRPRTRETPRGRLLVALGLVIAAVSLQLVPLASTVRGFLSPRLDAFLVQTDFHFVLAGAAGVHALSVLPEATWIGLSCLAAFALLAVGAAQRMGRRDVRAVAAGILALGVVVALEAIVQRAVSPSLIYGFWKPLDGEGAVFGPFVNRNHFAGWMLMALPLSLGYLADSTDRSRSGIPDGWRHTAGWLASPGGSRMLLLGFGVFVMALALVLTMSRSGIAATGFMLVAGLTIRGPGTARTSRRAVAGFLVVIAAIALAWAGSDAVWARFNTSPGGGLGGRVGAWMDALSIVRAFPLTGTGFNTFGHVMQVYQEHNPEKFYRAAHNDYLQIAADGGVLVAVPAAVLLVVFVLETRRAFRENGASTYWIRAGATTGLCAVALQELVDFSLQIPANAALCAVLAAIALHRGTPGSHANRSQTPDWVHTP
jgi:O-antigen ligase/polysaccharide polymerase Wzy-like membrane protein